MATLVATEHTFIELFCIAQSSEVSIVKWGEFAQLHAGKFRCEVTRTITTGPLVIDDSSSFTVLVHGHKAGLVLSRRFRPFNKKIWLEWQKIVRVVVLPPFLSGKLKRHTDAVLTLSEGPVSRITVPWMDEFVRLLPESIPMTRRNQR